MNNLSLRIFSAVVLVLVLVFLTHSTTAIPIKTTVVSILSLIILWEYSKLFKSRLFRIIFLMLVIGGLLFAPFFTEFLEKTSNYLFWFLCILWILILFKVLSYNKKNINDFFIVFSGFFIFFPFVTSLFFMIMMPGIFLYVIIIVSVADSAAFFVGKMAGKTPLLPNISPGKTVEGFIGGVLIASFFSCFIPLFIGLQDNLLEFLILGFLVALISVLGDLFFSMLKRNKGIKDSSHLIPGHGGFIDLLDGTIATLPLLTFLSFRMNELGSIFSLIGY